MRRFTPRNFQRLLEFVMEKGSKTQVRLGGKPIETMEIRNMHLVLRDPRDRLVINDARKINLPFAIAEWIGLITGAASVELFTNYIKNYGDYSSDGKMVDGAYGTRLHHPSNQVEGIIKKLTDDITSRQAVVTFYYGSTDLYGGGGKNTPCTLSMQFLVRDDNLHAITNMRSNDAIWGFNYDLIMFTMLQEYIARRLDVRLGTYYHNAGSFHIYEPHYYLVDAMKDSARWSLKMHSMPFLPRSEIDALSIAYHNPAVEDEKFERIMLALNYQYTKDLARAARAFVCRKDLDTFWANHDKIEDYTIRKTLRPWVD